MQRPRSQPALSTGYAHISSALHRLEFREGCPKFRFQSGFPIETVSTSRVLDEPPFDVAFHRCLVAHIGTTLTGTSPANPRARAPALDKRSGFSKLTCASTCAVDERLSTHTPHFPIAHR